MRIGVFDDFKGDRTLLFWGQSPSDFQPLLSALDEISVKRRGMTPVVFHGSEASERVTVVVGTAELGQGAVLIRRGREGPHIEVYCAHDTASAIADQVRSLDRDGHHYLYFIQDQPIQIMVSVGEYGPGLAPATA